LLLMLNISYFLKKQKTVKSDDITVKHTNKSLIKFWESNLSFYVSVTG